MLNILVVILLEIQEVFYYFHQINKNHPTQKPLKLCEYFIKTYTNENDLVLDNCCGSGTIPLACKNLNRRFIGMEIEEKYYTIAKERIEI